MRLITETSYDFDVIEESKKGEGMHIVGIYSTAEVENNNGRRYKKELLEREVDKLAPKLDKKCLWGELGHPQNPEINLDKIAILTKELKWKDNDVYGKSKILDTPNGKIAQTLIKEGNLGISSRGLGTVGEDGYVNEDFKLLVYDLVSDPSNQTSWINGIYEGKEWYVDNDGSIKEGIKKEWNVDEEQIEENIKFYRSFGLDNLTSTQLYKLFQDGTLKLHGPEEIKQIYDSIRNI